jgi:NADPH2:quinone reductase
VLVHGAAGAIGTAALQVARGLGARTIAVVSSDAKAHVARQAGAHDIVLFDDDWRARVRDLTDGGVDVVIDPDGRESCPMAPAPEPANGPALRPW